MGDASSQESRRLEPPARAVVFTLLVPLPIVLLVPWFLTAPPTEIAAFDGGRPASVAGALFTLAGALLFLRSTAEFVRAGGTPAHWDPPPRLVVGGPFSRSRNPLYVGILGVLFGEALLYGSTTLGVYTVCLALGFHARVRLYEEPRLRRKFGRSFEEYCRFVPRWFPRIYN